ncbi:MAG: AAA family ATPase [Synergistaceae bacterium]|nr:AAA family ATPase [Synergistaceae bacterium]
MPFIKAERKNAKLRLAITGPAGSGKTYGALLIAQGLGGKIAMIDTENGSGDLYAGLCDYDIAPLSAPYDPRRYIQLLHEAENSGYSVIIIDSLSHEWNGIGGCLDIHCKLTETKYRGNGYAAWREVTPLHQALVDALLASPAHIIATMRAKTEYVQNVNEKGRTEIHKVGLAPIQREGMDYEFGTVFDLSPEHSAIATKDRSRLFEGNVFTLSTDVGKQLRAWLDIVPSTQKGGEA